MVHREQQEVSRASARFGRSDILTALALIAFSVSLLALSAAAAQAQEDAPIPDNDLADVCPPVPEQYEDEEVITDEAGNPLCPGEEAQTPVGGEVPTDSAGELYSGGAVASYGSQPEAAAPEGAPSAPAAAGSAVTGATPVSPSGTVDYVYGSGSESGSGQSVSSRSGLSVLPDTGGVRLLPLAGFAGLLLVAGAALIRRS
ncbi:hypothetical protein [Rubrobacter radiotolerans]|uniref:hypothetical protein n=1 Tax=Rubrobacter radiotolerans TaxID=42256 RepID=UPI00059C8C1B|nr:hypothetical protein [Rubrobacter radiotolerans]